MLVLFYFSPQLNFFHSITLFYDFESIQISHGILRSDVLYRAHILDFLCIILFLLHLRLAKQISSESYAVQCPRPWKRFLCDGWWIKSTTNSDNLTKMRTEYILGIKLQEWIALVTSIHPCFINGSSFCFVDRGQRSPRQREDNSCFRTWLSFSGFW